jgi:hypothetical protein
VQAGRHGTDIVDEGPLPGTAPITERFDVVMSINEDGESVVTWLKPGTLSFAAERKKDAPELSRVIVTPTMREDLLRVFVLPVWPLLDVSQLAFIVKVDVTRVEDDRLRLATILWRSHEAAEIKAVDDAPIIGRSFEEIVLPEYRHNIADATATIRFVSLGKKSRSSSCRFG